MSSEIILCSPCNGVGFIETKELEDYHHGTYNVSIETCENCKGHGRLVKTITETILPFTEFDQNTRIDQLINKVRYIRRL